MYCSFKNFKKITRDSRNIVVQNLKATRRGDFLDKLQAFTLQFY